MNAQIGLATNKTSSCCHKTILLVRLGSYCSCLRHGMIAVRYSALASVVFQLILVLAWRDPGLRDLPLPDEARRNECLEAYLDDLTCQTRTRALALGLALIGRDAQLDFLHRSTSLVHPSRTGLGNRNVAVGAIKLSTRPTDASVQISVCTFGLLFTKTLWAIALVPLSLQEQNLANLVNAAGTTLTRTQGPPIHW